MEKNKKNLLLIPLIIGLGFVFLYKMKMQQKREQFFNDCFVISSQQATTDTAPEYENKISFHFEIVNLCEQEEQLGEIKIITKQKTDNTIVDQNRLIELSTTMEPRSRRSFDYVLNLNEEEFKKYHKYSLEIVN